MISDSLRNEVQNVLKHPVANITSVSGGSINQAAKIETKSGDFFLKWNSSAPDDMFQKEKHGLNLLHKADSGLNIPEVIGNGSTSDDTYFIVLSYISEGAAGDDSHKLLGRRLAALHQETVVQYGLSHNNYIGSLPQSNRPHDKWIDFFIEERLEPQLKRASDTGKLSSGTTQNFERLFKKLPDILTDEPPSLIHGDLWSGNYFFDKKGDPAIYDPAAYYGNREIEIAMTCLFGGFSTTFYDAYNNAFALQPNFNERKDIYNLYPLLVHTNLFGASYARRVEGIVQKF